MKKIIFILLAALCFVACDNDEDIVKKTFTINNIDGEWFFYDEENATSAIDMTITAKGLSYQATTYTEINKTPKIYDSQYGFFTYFKSTNSLRIEIHSQKQSQTYSADYELVDVDEYNLKLRNKEFNCIDSYYKVAATVELRYGQTTEIANKLSDKFKPSTFTSVSPQIATVDNNGIVIPTGVGTTFILATDGTKQVAVKIIVNSLADDHAAEVYESIENVLEKYGEPDVMADIANYTAGILYKNPTFEPAVSAIEFDYDKFSLKVTRILAKYASSESYAADVDFIKENFYEEYFKGICYCDKDNFMSSKVHICPYIQNGSYFVLYGSTTYWLLNGHY